MAPPPPPLSFLLFLILSSPATSIPTINVSSIITAACSRTQYPTVCVHTLTNTPLPTTTPLSLAQASISASLATTHTALSFLSRLPPPAPVSICDCREQLSDAADELSRTVTELGQLRPEKFRWQMDNALTWTSAAMTNLDTCVDGVKQQRQKEGGGDEVVRRVSGVSRVTSNALYFLNRLASTNGRGM